MRRVVFLVLAALMLCFVSCTTEIENELSALERRVKILEEKCQTINENIVAMQDIVKRLEEHVYVTHIGKTSDGTRDGYAITFSDGKTVAIYNGIDREDPVVGVEKDANGAYYWTITYEGTTRRLSANGVDVVASVVIPILKVDENGYWRVSYNNGEDWSSPIGQATGDNGKTWFTSLVDSTDYVILRLADDYSYIRILTQAYYERLANHINVSRDNMLALYKVYDALETKKYVSKVYGVVEGGKVIGHTIQFSDGEMITLYNGISNGLSIGAKKDSDGKYYWYYTDKEDIDHWVYDQDGNKILTHPDSVDSPEFGMDTAEDGMFYWTVKYAGDTTFSWILDDTGNKISSTVESPDLFKAISVDDTTVTIELANGDVCILPRFEDFVVNFSSAVYLVANATTTVGYEITGVDAEADIAALPQDGFVVKVLRNGFDETLGALTGDIFITAPDTFAEGQTSKVMVLVSDGYGHTKTVNINILYGVEE